METQLGTARGLCLPSSRLRLHPLPQSATKSACVENNFASLKPVSANVPARCVAGCYEIGSISERQATAFFLPFNLTLSKSAPPRTSIKAIDISSVNLEHRLSASARRSAASKTAHRDDVRLGGSNLKCFDTHLAAMDIDVR